MVWSEPMAALDFVNTEIITVSRMQKTLGQLENKKPRYVFIEKKLFLGKLPAVDYQHFQALSTLIRYLADRYEPYDQGKYLMALKHK